MKTYAGIFLLSLLTAALLTPAVRRFALRLGAVDRPGRRKVHRGEVPRLGGIAIYASFFLPLLSLLLLSNTVTEEMARMWPQILGLFVGSTIILIVGVADDLWGWSPWVKLPLEVFAAGIVCFMGFEIVRVTNPFGAPIELGAAGRVVTVIWIVGLANAINLIDGIDGLAAGVTAFAAVAISICALVLGHVAVAVLAMGLAGAILGFLHHNFHPAKIFMGDSGSLFVGFTLASLSIPGSLKSSAVVALAIPVLVFGLPIADTFLAAGRRLFRGRSIFRADDEHVHHTLLRQGFTQRQSSLILYAVTAFLGVAAILLTINRARTIGIGFIVTGVLGFIVVRQVLLARGRWPLSGERLDTLREARLILFRAGETLASARGEAAIWEAVRAAVEDLGYASARWVVERPDGGVSEKRWGGDPGTEREWDLTVTVPVERGRGMLLVNRPGGSALDFGTRDTILTILSDLAGERLAATSPQGGDVPAPAGEGRARPAD